MHFPVQIVALSALVLGVLGNPASRRFQADYKLLPRANSTGAGTNSPGYKYQQGDNIQFDVNNVDTLGGSFAMGSGTFNIGGPGGSSSSSNTSARNAIKKKNLRKQ